MKYKERRKWWREREGIVAKEEALQPSLWVTRDSGHLKCSPATI